MTRLSTLPQHKMTRAYVRSVPCPDCGVNAYEKCVGSKGQKRTSSHAARWGAYREAADSSKRKEIEMTTKKIYGPWIKWDGGECPVSPDTKVGLRFRSGATETGHRADAYLWCHGLNDPDDIVEYCVALEQADLDAAEQLLRANSYTVIPPAKPLTFADVVPMTEAPPDGTVYWVVSAGEHQGAYVSYFYGRDVDHRAIKRRMAYLDKEHALIAARHVFGLKGGEL